MATLSVLGFTLLIWSLVLAVLAIAGYQLWAMIKAYRQAATQTDRT